jgi:hypothetical protein
MVPNSAAIALFSDERLMNHRPQPAFQAHGVELVISLHGEHHPDETTGDDDDRDARDANGVEHVNKVARLAAFCEYAATCPH